MSPESPVSTWKGPLCAGSGPSASRSPRLILNTALPSRLLPRCLGVPPCREVLCGPGSDRGWGHSFPSAHLTRRLGSERVYGSPQLPVSASWGLGGPGAQTHSAVMSFCASATGLDGRAGPPPFIPESLRTRGLLTSTNPSAAQHRPPRSAFEEVWPLGRATRRRNVPGFPLRQSSL